MVMTLNDCMERINQTLNYPAVEYPDVSHYFDQAISELNSTLRIGIKPISHILKTGSFDVYTTPNAIAISESEVIAPIPVLEKAPDDISCYFDSTCDKFGIKKSGSFEYYDTVYGYVPTSATISSNVYKAVYYSKDSVFWSVYNADPNATLNLIDWLPFDVLILFIIPYVCNKFSIRDGGNGAIFREEFVQGFQQIQTSYDIPNTVYLPSVAGRKAYTEDIEACFAANKDINMYVPTRAIYDNMKIGNAVHPTYGEFYEGGGWGF